MTELAKISAPLLLRELILYVKNEAVVVPNTLAGGVGLAVFLLALVLLQACMLQHFIHGGDVANATLCFRFFVILHRVDKRTLPHTSMFLLGVIAGIFVSNFFIRMVVICLGTEWYKICAECQMNALLPSQLTMWQKCELCWLRLSRCIQNAAMIDLRLAKVAPAAAATFWLPACVPCSCVTSAKPLDA